MEFTDKKILSAIKQRHYKLTPQRRAVLKILDSSQEYLTPFDIYEKVRQEYPGIGLVTIYRFLQILTELGLVCEIHSDESCRCYIIKREATHHHHLICSNCGKVVDFTGCDLGKLQERLSHDTGFEMKGHLLELYGLCHNCRMINSNSQQW